MLNSTEICREALAKYGPQAQTIMVFEEMSELQKELCKNQRGKKNVGAIAEEIVDVLVTLEQMAVLHDCEADVIKFREQKFKRLKERIDGGNNL